jgi:D-psicose/D-tagatose/L-ribulose 3-epimerase
MQGERTGRIRYGGHMYLWAERWSDDRLGLLSHVRDLGLELFEVSLGDDSHFSPKSLRREVAALDLELTIGPGGVWPMECDISLEDPHGRALGVAWHERLIDLAAQSGASAYCGAIYGHPGRVLRRRADPDEYPRIAEGLHHLAEYAAQVGVRLVIEPMSRFRSHVVNTPQQATRLVEMADHDNLEVTLDTYHLITEVRDYGAAIKTIGSRLWGLHACENDRGVPGGGLVPWESVFDALVIVQPDARVMLETYNTALNDLAVSRGIFLDLCPDPDAFVRQGLTFLQQCESDAAKRRRRIEQA